MAFERFCSGSALMLICTSPTLKLAGNEGEGPAVMRT
jgi:hypothetical protein